MSQLTQQGAAAKAAARILATAGSEQKNRALAAIADTLEREQARWLAANAEDVAAAKEAGMRVCAVYDDSSAEYTQEMKNIADAYIEDFSQLMACTQQA